MATLLLERTVCILNEILEMRLSGVIRYTNYSLIVSGRDRLSFSEFFTQKANASLQNGQEAGRILMAMNERPLLASKNSVEPTRQSTREMLLRSLNHERQLLKLHRELLEMVRADNCALEVFAARTLLISEANCQQFSDLLADLEDANCVRVCF